MRVFMGKIESSTLRSPSCNLFDRVVRSKRKIYRNGLQEGDLKVPLCGFGGVKCKLFVFSRQIWS